MQPPDLTNPVTFIITLILFFLIICIRYFIFSGVFYLFFHSWYKQYWQVKKVSQKEIKLKQIKKEIKWSLVTSFIFAATANVTLLFWEKGFTRIYTTVTLRDVWYIPFSLIILIFIHETYYYWLHRWMHQPGVFKIVHKVHHESKTTSPFSAFSFHPLESILQAIFFPVILLLIPIHYMVLGTLLIFMTFTSMVNHLNIEIYPQNFNKNLLGRWFIGATHHSLHHSEFKVNYGLYLTVWDKIKRTESKNYHPLFKKITSKSYQ